MFSVSYPVVAGLAARWNQDWLKERSYALMNAHPLNARIGSVPGLSLKTRPG